MEEKKTLTSPFPDWLKRPLPGDHRVAGLKSLLRNQKLHTVCESARCPNIGECFSRKTATFMIAGNVCTRVCKFCDVKSGRPLALDPNEPAHIAETTKELGLEYVVITAVNRDDLADGGADHFCKVAKALKKLEPAPKYEFLIPDFAGKTEPLEKVVSSKPVVLNHNLETVRRLTPEVRNKANYERSLALLKHAKSLNECKIKTGVMLGLGESREDLLQLFEDVADSGCDILTMGQYLRPSKNHLEVKRFVPPEEFKELKALAIGAGIKTVFSGPFVRSSFHAGEVSEGLVDF